MKRQWTIGIVSAVFAIGLVGSNAFAMKTTTETVDRYQQCGATCAHGMTQTLDETYPSAQPLEVCDDICIFY